MSKFRLYDDDWVDERAQQRNREQERRERAVNKKKSREQLYNLNDEDINNGKKSNR